MRLSYALASLIVLTQITATAHAGDARPMNSADDVALRNRLAAEADAKRALTPSAPSSGMTRKEWAEFSAHIGRLCGGLDMERPSDVERCNDRIKAFGGH